jgi:hypothetical protein
MPAQYAVTAFAAAFILGAYFRGKWDRAGALFAALIADDFYDVWPTDEDVYDHERSGL